MVERLWTQPALSVIGLDAPKVDGSSNTLIPAARARLALRTAPGETSANAVACLREHLEKHVPWGASSRSRSSTPASRSRSTSTGPAYDAARAAFAEAWDGTEPVDMGVGGSIPFIAEFLDAMPGASVLVTGVEDPDTRAHGANEGLHLAEFEKVLRRRGPDARRNLGRRRRPRDRSPGAPRSGARPHPVSAEAAMAHGAIDPHDRTPARVRRIRRLGPR